ncbi:MAG: hypothetical protein IBX48_08430 [Thiomicrospira sp.]|nr:hypothetical protein [Thiomicrospira sp.]MBE0494355.1 hypothetical protein [Thiomicrospira sp.]
MWIENIGTIAMISFVVLVTLKLSVLFIFKWQKHRKRKQKGLTQNAD